MPSLVDNKPVVAVPATSSATAAPNAGSEGVVTGSAWLVRVLCAYAGMVNACNLRFWVRDPSEGGAWYAGSTTDALEPLSPGGASPTNEAREIEVGRNQEVFVQVASIAGGGTVAVRLQAVQLG